MVIQKFFVSNRVIPYFIVVLEFSCLFLHVVKRR